VDKFNLDGIVPGKTCGVTLMSPQEAAEGRPWVWRAEFFDAFAGVDLDLVRRGWRLAYKDYDDSPLNHAPALAKRGIPVILVSGDADEAVYYPENGGAFERRYRENGGPITVIIKPGGRHHPHKKTFLC
jgi:alpha-beta hydrolase superfamily lysophospholipase